MNILVSLRCGFKREEAQYKEFPFQLRFVFKNPGETINYLRRCTLYAWSEEFIGANQQEFVMTGDGFAFRTEALAVHFVLTWAWTNIPMYEGDTVPCYGLSQPQDGRLTV